MAYADLREFIAVLEKSDELLRVPVGVDWKYEVSGWIRKSADMRPKGPALLFENIKGDRRNSVHHGKRALFFNAVADVGDLPRPPVRFVKRRCCDVPRNLGLQFFKGLFAR